ncbi:MAG: hypothetical protein JWM93_2245, partial [Frankiales bacterium]|nr:hypothetical protein [Frankiales bacterium]
MRRRAVSVLAGLTALLAPPIAASPAAAASGEPAMTLWSCSPDRGALAVVDVTWLSRTSARVTWKVSDMLDDGKVPRLRIRAVDFNGSSADTSVDLFSGTEARVQGGRGRSVSGARTWTPTGTNAFDELEVWVTNGVGANEADCGWEFAHRINNYLHGVTAPISAAKSKPIRDRIVAAAYAEMRAGYHERAHNCSKYTDYFTSPNACRPWCTDFTSFVWVKAGVPGAKAYNSSYALDFRDEWRIRFKPVNGSIRPLPG